MSELMAEAKEIIDKDKKARELKCREAIGLALKDFDCILSPSAVFRPGEHPVFQFTIVST